MGAKDRISSIVLLILAIGACIGASKLQVGSFNNPGSGFFPFVLGIVIGFLALLILGTTIYGKQGVKEETGRLSSGRQMKVLYILVALVCYALLLEKLGHLITTFLLFIFLLRGINPQKWSFVIGGALLSSLGSYALFQIGLNVQLPKGFLGM